MYWLYIWWLVNHTPRETEEVDSWDILYLYIDYGWTQLLLYNIIATSVNLVNAELTRIFYITNIAFDGRKIPLQKVGFNDDDKRIVYK
jgi:hypothetical protein